MERQKQRRLRFTHEDDVIFLREVVQQIPMLHPERWEIVQINPSLGAWVTVVAHDILMHHILFVHPATTVGLSVPA